MRDVRHWAFAAMLGFVLGMSSLIWITARGQLRQDIDEEVVTASRVERFDRARTVSTGIMNQSASDYLAASGVLIERLWAIYYPAMAVERVPFLIPHSDGQIMSDALTHLITPRFLYPDKADLASDSDMVRKYSGANVAGTDEGTSIAFGYAAESYVDFGLPYMFIPVMIFGFLLGLLYQMWFSVIKHRELAIGLVTVIFWITLYLFERSWVKTMGTTITMMVYLGGMTYLVDQWLLMRRTQAHDTGIVDPFLPAAE
jgi:lipopolysaccharide export LptBFGC system permease protein LptF